MRLYGSKTCPRKGDSCTDACGATTSNVHVMTAPIMEFTGERYVPQLKGPIYYEHAHRYAMAVPLVEGKDVLDIASGEGYGTVLLARHARSVIGVDIDVEAIAHARRAYDVPNAFFRVGSCEAIPLADASVDVVVSFETLEHLTEHETFVAEVRRVLRPGGMFLVSSPNKREYSDVPQFQNPYHLRELYFSEFRDFLSRTFKHVAIFGQRLSGVSLIYALGGTSASSAWLSSSDNDVRGGLPALANPLYFIGVCSDEPLPDAVATSAFVDPDDDLLRHYGPTPAPPMNEPEAIAASPALLALRPGAQPPPHGDPRADEFAELHRKIADLEDISARAHGRIGELEAQLAEREAQLTERDAEVHGLTARLAEASRVAAEAAAAYEERLARERAVRESAASEYAARLADAEGRLADATESHAAERGRWEDERATWETEKLANLRVLAELRRLESELQRARAAATDGEQHLTREREQQAAQHAADQREIEHLRALLHDVMTSKSWTLTKPLRRAMRTLRRDKAQ